MIVRTEWYNDRCCGWMKRNCLYRACWFDWMVIIFYFLIAFAVHNNLRRQNIPSVLAVDSAGKSNDLDCPSCDALNRSKLIQFEWITVYCMDENCPSSFCHNFRQPTCESCQLFRPMMLEYSCARAIIIRFDWIELVKWWSEADNKRKQKKNVRSNDRAHIDVILTVCVCSLSAIRYHSLMAAITFHSCKRNHFWVFGSCCWPRPASEGVYACVCVCVEEREKERPKPIESQSRATKLTMISK